MTKRYWAPILAVAAAIMILVPTTLAQGEPGTAMYATFQSNRFPGNATTATGQLNFLANGQVRLDVTVSGSDIRTWTIRIYRGLCNNVVEWLANRTSAGAPLAKAVTNGGTLRQVLFSADAARIHRAINRGQPFALMLAGQGSGGTNSGSAYRTCTRFGPNQMPITSTTTSTTTSLTNTSACLTTRTINGTATTVTGRTTTIGGTVTTIGGTTTTIGGQTTTVGGTVTTINGTTVTVPGTATTIMGTTNSATTIGDVVTTIGGTTSTIPAITTTVGGTVTTITGTATTITGTATTVGATTVTITPTTSTSLGTLTTATGTRTGGTGTCVFP